MITCAVSSPHVFLSICVVHSFKRFSVILGLTPGCKLVAHPENKMLHVIVGENIRKAPERTKAFFA